MKKRILSLLLAIVMVATLLPTAALAEEESNGHSGHGHTCGESCSHVTGDPHKAVASADWTAWDLTTTLPNDGTYYLTADVTLSAQWEPTGKVTLCLNGHSITQNATDTSVIFVNSKRSLTITDCGTNVRTGHIDAATNLWTAGDGKENETACNLTGGLITGYNGQRYSCGAVHNKGTFVMYAGNISGNVHHVRGGGGVWNEGTFTMYGGTITGNTATDGGGVLVYQGTFAMYGGTIRGNTASYYGGGVCVNADTFTMNGGTISDNTATHYGGGVYFKGANFFLSGNCIIAGNHKGTGESASDNNVYLCTGQFGFVKTITVSGALDEDTSIGITTATAPTEGSPVCITPNYASTDYSRYFFSDNEGYHIDKAERNSKYQVVLAYGPATPTAYAVDFNPGGGTGTVPTMAATAAGATFTVPDADGLTKEGYTFAGWNDGSTTYAAGDIYTMPAKDVTFTAQWTAKT